MDLGHWVSETYRVEGAPVDEASDEVQRGTAPRASEKAIAQLRTEGMPCLSHEVVMTPVRRRASVMPLLGGVRVEF